jgi:hypothetical protein
VIGGTGFALLSWYDWAVNKRKENKVLELN